MNICNLKALPKLSGERRSGEAGLLSVQQYLALRKKVESPQ
ncbi:hypothetical protein [Salmonella enterica]|nr:hypothetical protein [Salmonella enterica]